MFSLNTRLLLKVTFNSGKLEKSNSKLRTKFMNFNNNKNNELLIIMNIILY